MQAAVWKLQGFLSMCDILVDIRHKSVNTFQPLIITTKSFMLDVR